MNAQDDVWIFYTFEIVTYVYFLVMARHAWTATRNLPLFGTAQATVPKDDLANRGRWLSTLVWGAIFGVVIELILTTLSTYRYSDNFLIRIPIPCSSSGDRVPLCIGVGWGVLLYATTWTSQRLKLKPFVRAILAGLLAVSVDFGLDPAADRFRFWVWPNEEDYPAYFGVPFDNFIGWFLIVSFYSGLVRWFFLRLDERVGSVYWAPALSALISIAIVCGIDELVLPAIYKLFDGDILPFIFLFGVVSLVVVVETLRQGTPLLSPSWPVLLVPVVYSGMCWVLLLAKGIHRQDDNAAMLLAIPLSMIVSATAFGWGSLCRLLSRES